MNPLEFLCQSIAGYRPNSLTLNRHRTRKRCQFDLLERFVQFGEHNSQVHLASRS